MVIIKPELLVQKRTCFYKNKLISVFKYFGSVSELCRCIFHTCMHGTCMHASLTGFMCVCMRVCVHVYVCVFTYKKDLNVEKTILQILSCFNHFKIGPYFKEIR